MIRRTFERLLRVLFTLWVAVTAAYVGLDEAFGLYDEDAMEEAITGPAPAGFTFEIAPPPRVSGPEPSPLERYLAFLGRAVRLDWGISESGEGRPAGDVLREGFPITATIGLLAFLLGMALGVPLGVVAATRRGWVDIAVSSGATLANGFPNLMLAILLLVWSVYTIQVFPAGWNGKPVSYLLPVLVLGLGAGGYLARVTRTAVLEVLGQDYVRTARAKGLPERVVDRRHVFRNALPTVLAALGPTVGLILAGSVLVEFAYEVPGAGRQLLVGLSDQDAPVVIAGVALYTAILLGADLASDLAAGLADPRVRRGAA